MAAKRRNTGQPVTAGYTTICWSIVHGRWPIVHGSLLTIRNSLLLPTHTLQHTTCNSQLHCHCYYITTHNTQLTTHLSPLTILHPLFKTFFFFGAHVFKTLVHFITRPEPFAAHAVPITKTKQ